MLLLFRSLLVTIGSPMQQGVAILHGASRTAYSAFSGSQPVKTGFVQGYKSLPSRKGKIPSLSGSITSKAGIRVVRKGIHPQLSGNVTSARGTAPSPRGMVTSVRGIHPQLLQQLPSASGILTFFPGIHPSARKEAPQSGPHTPVCGSERLLTQNRTQECADHSPTAPQPLTRRVA